jgi:hypothetical protein
MKRDPSKADIRSWWRVQPTEEGAEMEEAQGKMLLGRVRGDIKARLFKASREGP